MHMYLYIFSTLSELHFVLRYMRLDFSIHLNIFTDAMLQQTRRLNEFIACMLKFEIEWIPVQQSVRKKAHHGIAKCHHVLYLNSLGLLSLFQWYEIICISIFMQSVFKNIYYWDPNMKKICCAWNQMKNRIIFYFPSLEYKIRLVSEGKCCFQNTQSIHYSSTGIMFS